LFVLLLKETLAVDVLAWSSWYLGICFGCVTLGNEIVQSSISAHFDHILIEMKKKLENMQVIPKEESTIEVAMGLDDPLLSPDRLLHHFKTGDTAYPWCDTSLYIFIYLHQKKYPVIVDWIKNSGTYEWKKIFTDCTLRLKTILESGQITNLSRIQAVDAIRIDHLINKGLIFGPSVSYITSPPTIDNDSLTAIIQSSFESVNEFFNHSDIMASAILF
jgi:hypothetical protein